MSGPADELSVESLLAQAADEFSERLNRGERPEVEEYVQRYPQVAAFIRELFPALQMLRGPAGAAGEGLDALPAVGCLGDFRILGEVGRGGMGIVYEAEQVSLGRRVALKVLPLAAALDARQLQRFKTEALAAGQLHHTNIVPVYAVGCERGVHYYAMQFIDGRTLVDVIAEQRRGAGLPRAEGESPTSRSLPAGRVGEPVTTSSSAGVSPTNRSPHGAAFFRSAAQLMLQAAEAVEHAHSAGVLHRDIKPANLLVDAGGRLWVTDFGLACVRGDARLTFTGDLVGTLRYMSPEQALGLPGSIDHRTDIYSLGVTLYELLTLEPAFAGRDRQELLRRIAQDEVCPPRRRNRAVPPELETIVLKAAAKDSGERYATAQELADDLRRFLEDRPVLARRPTLQQRARKWAKRHRTVLTASASAAVLALAASTVLVTAAYRAEAEQRRKAETQEREANDQREAALVALARARTQTRRAEGNFAKTLEAIDAMLRVVKDDPTAQEGLRQRALEFYQNFLTQSGSDPETRLERALVHRRLADLHRLTADRQAPRSEEGKAALARAAASLHEAATLFEQLAADFPDEPRHRQEQAGCYQLLLHTLPGTTAEEQRERQKEQEVLYRRLATLWKGCAADFPADSRYRVRLVQAYMGLGYLLSSQRRNQEAEDAFRQAIGTGERLVADFPGEPHHRRDLASSHTVLAAFLGGTGRGPEALVAYREAIAIAARLAADFPTPDNREDLAVRNTALAAELGRGQPEAAAETHRQALAVREQLVGDFPAEMQYRVKVDESYLSLFLVWKGAKQPAKAEAALRRRVALYEVAEAKFPDRAATAGWGIRAHADLGDWLQQTGRDAEAAPVYCRALKASEAGLSLRLKGAATPDYMPADGELLALAEKVIRFGQVEEAERAYRLVLTAYPAMMERLSPRSGAFVDFAAQQGYLPGVAAAGRGLGELLLNTGRAEEAETVCRQALMVCDKWGGEKVFHLLQQGKPGPYPLFELEALHNSLGVTAASNGKLVEAEAAFRKALALREPVARSRPDEPSFRIRLHARLAAVLRKRGRRDEAEQELHKALEVKGPDRAGDNRAIVAGVLADDVAVPLRDPARAVEVAKQAAEREGRWDALGIAQYRAGDWAAALASFEKANQRFPGGGPWWFFQAMAHRQLEEVEKARQRYEQAVRWLETYQGPAGAGLSSGELHRLRSETEILLGLSGRRADWGLR